MLVNQASNKHGGSGTGPAQVFFENRPTGFEIQPVGQYIMDAYNVIKAAAGLKQCFLDIGKTLLGLFDEVIRYAHSRVVITGSTGDINSIAVDDGARITNLFLEFRATRYQFTGRFYSPQ